MHAGRLDQKLRDEGVHVLKSRSAAESRARLFEFPFELSGVLDRSSGRVRGLLQQDAQLVLQSFQRLNVTRDDEARMQVVDILLRKRFVRLQASLKHSAQRGVDAGDVLVPQCITQRMQRCGLSRHERQRQA